tara:strand:- start:273 stop:776 length:504 start_codon:yes stop_codon:yes gene_type:complete
MPHYLNIDDDDDNEKFNYTFYKIFKNGCESYIGSTKDLKQRISTHKYDCNTKFIKNGNKRKHYNKKVYQYIRENGGFDTFDFEVIDKKYCCKKDAEIHESELMKIHKSTLNVRRNYTEEDIKQHNKEYKKSDKYKEYQKDYQKNYYQKKKQEKINITINLTINLPQN